MPTTVEHDGLLLDDEVEERDSAAFIDIPAASEKRKGDLAPPAAEATFLGTPPAQQVVLDENFTSVIYTLEEGVRRYPPELLSEGEGGAYVLRDARGRKVGVFKPTDADPQGSNNPKKRMKKTHQAGDNTDPGEHNDAMHSASPVDSLSFIVRATIPLGETAVREVAAYAIDRGFAGVPPTALVSLRRSALEPANDSSTALTPPSETFAQGASSSSATSCPPPPPHSHDECSSASSSTVLGSFQRYVSHECGSWDLAAYKFAVEDVHRIGLLDLRIFNTDRHGGNMLAVLPRRRRERSQSRTAKDEDGDVDMDALYEDYYADSYDGDYREHAVFEGVEGDEDDDDYICPPLAGHGDASSYRLVPIDHGFAFPVSLGEANFEWLYWPQARKPFSEEIRRRVELIDPQQDEALLRDLGLCEEAIRVNKIATLFVKKGVRAGLTLAQLGKLVYRRRTHEPSALEEACDSAKAAAGGRTAAFWQSLEQSIATMIDNALQQQ